MLTRCYRCCPQWTSSAARRCGSSRAATTAWCRGAERVVAGTAAFATPDAAALLAAVLGERLVVALDVRDGRAAVAGWTRDGGLTVDEALDVCAAAGVRRLLCTAVERDGTLAGPDLDLLARVCARAIPVL